MQLKSDGSCSAGLFKELRGKGANFFGGEIARVVRDVREERPLRTQMVGARLGQQRIPVVE